MSGIGSFMNAFAATTMEGQKRKQEFMQFQMQLAVQQAALQQQQMNMQVQNQQFQQQMQFKEQQRKDDLAQQKTQNQLGTFRAQTEAFTAQSADKARVEGLEEKKRASEAALQQKYDAARNDKTAVELQKKIANQKAHGVDTSKLEGELEQRYQELGGRPPESAQSPAGSQTAQAAPGQAQAGPLTGQPQAEPMAAQGQVGPPAPQGPSADRIVSPDVLASGEQPQPQRGVTPAPQQAAEALKQPASDPSAGMEEFPVKTPQEEERWNKFFKDNDIPKVAISDETKQKNERQKKKDRFDAAVADAATAGMPENVGAITDIFRQHGLDVDVEAHQKGTKIRSRRAGGHIGGSVFGPMGLSFGGTEGKSEQTVPTIDLFPKTKATAMSGAYGAIQKSITGEAGNEDKSLDTTIAMGNALADAASKGIPVSQPYVGAVKDVARDRIVDTLGTYAKKPVIEARPFDSVLEPARQRAAGSAVALTQLDQKLAQISEKNGVDYATLGVPKVQDAGTTPKEVLGSFGQAIDKISTQYPNMNPHRAEGQVLSELTTRLQNQQLDPAARSEAEAMLKRISKSTGVSDQFKKGAVRVLEGVLGAPEGEGGAAPTAKAKTPGKSTAALEEGSRRTAEGKMVASAENVTAANKALGTVAPNTKDKDAAAKGAVNTVKTNYKDMTDAEKKKAQEAWKAKRSTPAWKAVSEPIRMNMNEAYGLARTDGLTA